MTEMSDSLYHTLCKIATPLKYKVQGLEHIIRDVPAVFVSNHARNQGPLQVILNLPVRVYPWAAIEMTDPARIQGYIYTTFVAPRWHIRGQPGNLLAKWLGKLMVLFVRGLNCIPIDHARERYQDAFNRSLNLLASGRSLLIFPERKHATSDPVTHIRPFMPGFVQLAALYWRKFHQDLTLYPVAVVPPRRTLVIGEPRYLAAGNYTRGELLRSPALMQNVVSSLYLACLMRGQQLQRTVRTMAAGGQQAGSQTSG